MGDRRAWRWAACGVLVVGCLAVGPAAGAQAGPVGGSAGSSGGMNGAPAGFGSVPSESKGYGAYLSVAVVSASDAWAVGYQHRLEFGRGPVLLAHWDGTSWTRVSVPNPGNGTTLQSVSADAPDDVWATGFALFRNGGIVGLVLHWDGHSWTETRMPGDDGVWSAAISASAPDDVWRASRGSNGLAVQHWDGKKWTTTRVPERGEAFWYAVKTFGPNDAWVAGGACGYVKADHWDGTKWTYVPMLNPRKHSNSVFGLDGASSSDLWAVGNLGTHLCDDSDTEDQTLSGAAQPAVAPSNGLAEHWDGSTWTQTKMPGSKDGVFSDVEELSPDDVWAVGDRGRVGGTRGHLVEHWDGSSWSLVQSVKPPKGADVGLTSVKGSGPDDVWAVGGTNDNKPWIQHWNGTKWTVVALP